MTIIYMCICCVHVDVSVKCPAEVSCQEPALLLCGWTANKLVYAADRDFLSELHGVPRRPCLLYNMQNGKLVYITNSVVVTFFVF